MDRLVLQTAAVLADEGTPSRVAEMAGMDPGQVVGSLSRLREAGLLETGRFRDSPSRWRVLTAMPRERKRALHVRAAQLLHRDRAGVAVVARHLEAAGTADGDWGVQVLFEAAGEAIFDNRFGAGNRYLGLAYRESSSESMRAEIVAVQALVEWQFAPSASSRNYRRLKSVVRAGQVPDHYRAAVARLFLWYGDAAATKDALDLLMHSGAEAQQRFAWSWLRYFVPGVHARYADAGRRRAALANRGAAGTAAGGAAELLADTGQDAGSGQRTDPALAGDAALRTLRTHRLSGSALVPLVNAVGVLGYHERLDEAEAWCGALIAQADARGVPMWRSMLRALRSSLRLRSGDLRGALADARSSLGVFPVSALGTGAIGPIATSVRAATAMGRCEQAAVQLAHPLPDIWPETMHGLLYRQARGHFRLAAGRPEEALADFRDCGARMLRWGIDRPGLVAWRNDVAQAHLVLGDRRRARRFAARHLAVLGPADAHVSGAASLRLLGAAADDPSAAVVLLERSLSIAAARGNAYEQALTQEALAAAHERAGDRVRSMMAARKGNRLARECGAAPLAERLAALAGDDARPGAADADAGPDPGRPAPDRLTSAERRVAECAAEGLRNRDIAARLDVTVSTVEQHLTKAYRKLGINRREDLSYALIDA
ncbi:LuxR C-terminal-related transcriptional regulator [Actinomadura chokoriensis]|uniref:LuxR C-terminal-related transcriptional regulator n=1 Tax=Actinomadura chokoriensis TaxID=454156 RepID=A0ABV4R4Y4_9ACTN